MKMSTRVVYLVVAALILLTPLAAEPPTVTFALNSPGSGANLAGVYTSPYTGTINGGPTTNVICDDFADESYVPETWTAYQTSLSSLTSSADPYLNWQTSTFSQASSLTQTQDYQVAAILAIKILQASTGSTQQKDLSFALWALFDPYGNGNPSDPGALGQLSAYGDTSDINAAIADLNAAIGDLTTGINGQSVSSYLSNYNVTIYSWDKAAGAPTGACGGPCPAPQEFITVTAPEASTPVVLAADLLGLGIIGLLRKRILRNS